ncbi:hypothetical protein A2767_02000 [Candidatus Roizmanbacteria bacterium RIFCSPHIGHO2_01_FULL_35_10]|uniref:Nucleotidyl transferase AbiEii/AbiGii toxin family protein n=1 Tax=Candidatus Roizmanbacteria bacterium RIFCSPLOWO2_01_FULL_35_13 TaxID=1802055 RepID=A0A1F7I7B4_9BACT|nr:MAG: hypothetical protein A2767_02000 [Candidatus Roizmanbacteria bacterium RIFCSPHIGHO2_01_FULL_35_10]OGK39233.1 MAG: hypothetical protein A3A74_07415 [Candidatus Roizmanbacteria bacterium RIFCSPLOWO2_01_FULL_35_13]
MSHFTPTQKLIFDKVRNSDFFRTNFYFTGGTALSEFYLQHRYSEDLDFFPEKKFGLDIVREKVSLWSKDHKFTFKAEFVEFVYIFILNFSYGTSLKLDFGYYPHQRLEKGKMFGNFAVDSLLDIAVNKLSAINQRSTVRDFVDLYFLLDKFTIWDLIEGVRVKFNQEIDYWILGADLGYTVEQFDTLPKMIKPLTLNRLKNFYRKLAKDLGKRLTE